MIWVQRWEQPIAEVNWRFEWLWLVGFVHPESGQTKGVDCTTAEYLGLDSPTCYLSKLI